MQTISPEPAAAEPGTQTAETARHGRTLGRGRTILAGALGAVVGLSTGLAVGIPGGIVTAAETPTTSQAQGTSDAAGDNEVIIGVVERVAPAVVTINVT